VAIEGITRLDENEEFKSSGGEGRGGVEPAWRGKREGGCSNQHLVSGEIETPIPLILKGVAEEDTDSSRG
jgi:hypothetical protein